MSTNTKRAKVVDPNTLPPELIKNLTGVKLEEGYTLRDLAIAYINHHGTASLDDLLIYIYKVRNKISSRGYMYQLVHRLRKEGLVQSIEKKAPHNIVYRLTPDGEKIALPYLSSETGEPV